MRTRHGEPMTDEGFLASLNSSLTAAGVKMKVIQFNGRQGIIRVSGQDQKKAVDSINDQPNGALETLRASGTLRTLREGVLSSKKELSSRSENP